MYKDSSAFESIETDQSDRFGGFVTRMKLFAVVTTLPFNNEENLPYINHTFYASPDISKGAVHKKYLAKR